MEPLVAATAGRLRGFSVAHYEVLPETPDRRGAAPDVLAPGSS